MKKLVSLLLALVLIFAMSSVAMAADYSVSTEAELKAAIVDGANITLANNITLTSGIVIDAGKEVVLNLNGHTLAYTAEEASTTYLIQNNGKLTINGEGTITNVALNPDSNWEPEGFPTYANNTITNCGILEINGGTYINGTTGVGACYVIDNNSGVRDAILTINNGTLIGEGNVAIRQFCNSTANENIVNILGGDVSGKRAVWIQLPSGNNAHEQKAAINISGGTLTANGESGGYKLAIYSYSHGASYTDVEINISGGTFEGDVAIGGGTGNGGVGSETMNITGGTFEGEVYTYNEDKTETTDVIEVSGGVFKAGMDGINDFVTDGIEIKTDKYGNSYIGDSIAEMPVPPAAKRYDIKVADTKNGDVTVKGSASYDSGVIITAAPHYGYEVGTVTVTDANGKAIKVTNRADGTYSFSMPRGEVTIKVTFVPQGEAVKMVLTIGSKEVVVGGKTITNDVAPVIKASRTFLPVRLIAENLGATVIWDEPAQRVAVTKGDTTIELFINSTTVLVNGQPAELEAPVFIENSRTYLPVRFIAEKLGADVEWNGATNEVTITGRK